MRFRARIVLHRHRAHRAAHGLFERDHDVALDVASARGKILFGKTAARTRAIGAAAHSRTEHLLEEIAEARAAEFKFMGLASAAKSARLSGGSPARRRTKLRAGFPVRAEFVVFFPLGRIAQDFVGFVDLLEFFLGLLFVLGDVGMKFAREFAEGFLSSASLAVRGTPRLS